MSNLKNQHTSSKINTVFTKIKCSTTTKNTLQYGAVMDFVSSTMEKSKSDCFLYSDTIKETSSKKCS